MIKTIGKKQICYIPVACFLCVSGQFAQRERVETRRRETPPGAQLDVGVLAPPLDEPEAGDAAAGRGATATVRLDLTGGGARCGSGGDDVGEEET